MWVKMYFSQYDMIVDCEADRGTAGDGQSDCTVGGDVSFYVSFQVLLFV